ncbi:hypothetical protein [Bradyrhizobium cenepequi]|uniref:hypothetical protein n=1 Tax=Bradyrhizobium cenepequi TaxID=2821403 RepID=UPI001CE2BAF3|nr:hypothetical protein [Bradyrhizobium cenepequi]MCA6112584.1 hypothetical protein [Bradyrhizobium cenepequi]
MDTLGISLLGGGAFIASPSCFEPGRVWSQVDDGASRELWGLSPNDRTGAHLIGGFCQHTAVSRHGINVHIVERWPEDRIGRRIVPAGATDTLI